MSVPEKDITFHQPVVGISSIEIWLIPFKKLVKEKEKKKIVYNNFGVDNSSVVEQNIKSS